jgi:hydrogenase expression/formation protein HypC
MCLALPAEIVSVDPGTETAIVALGPVRKEVSVALLDNPQVGEFVLIHVGFALHRLSPEEAARTLALIEAAGTDPIAEFAS